MSKHITFSEASVERRRRSMGSYRNPDDCPVLDLATQYFTVNVDEVKLVYPAGPTKHETLYLSNIDQMLAVPVESFFVYLPNAEKSTENVFTILEEALAKLLVPYHFMAGRFAVNEKEGSRLELNCNRAGACFVAASSEQTIEELGDVKQYLNPEFRQLVPAAPTDDAFLLMVQVTRFKCGGFTVGFNMSHAMCDGVSSAQLFSSFCKLARGEELTVIPNPDRTILKPREPPKPEFSHPECTKLTDLPCDNAHTAPPPDYMSKPIDISLVEIRALKTIAMWDGNIKQCSSFEVLVAHIWQARTRTLQFVSGEHSKIHFAVDFRKKVQPPIPPTFFGNTIISALASAPADEVSRSPLSFCVAKVQEAAARIDEPYMRSAIDWLQIHGRAAPAIGSNGVLVSAWWKLPFYEHDYGWGRPFYAGPPAPTSPQAKFAVITSNGTGDGGLRVMLGGRSADMAKFEKHIKDIGEANKIYNTKTQMFM